MTILAKELRPGNYHKTAGLEIPRMDITSFKIDGQAFSAISAYGIYLVSEYKLDFEPITLTREWLFRFGFKYKPSGAGGQDQWAGYGSWSLNSLYFLGNRDGKFLYYNRDEKIKLLYVHRLQNLCFELGEELKINEIRQDNPGGSQ